MNFSFGLPRGGPHSTISFSTHLDPILSTFWFSIAIFELQSVALAPNHPPV